MESFSEEVGLRLPVFLLTLPDMPLVWPLTRLSLRVLFEVKWNFYCRRCAVIYPTPETFLTTGLVTNFSGSITKDTFSLNSSLFSTSAIILSRYYRFLHWMRLRQFTSFNPLLITWNQTALPSLPRCSQSLTPFVRLWTGSLFGTCENIRFCSQAICLGKGWKNRKERERVRA